MRQSIPAKQGAVLVHTNPKELAALEASEAFQLFKTGLHLHVWRNSSPHNYWLAPASNPNDYAYHWEDRESPSALFLSLGDKIEPGLGDQGKVAGIGYDRGMTVTETWRFSPQKLAAAWAALNPPELR